MLTNPSPTTNEQDAERAQALAPCRWLWGGATVIALLVLALGFCAVLYHGVVSSGLNADEGFYLASARATLEGKLPYRDYGFTQGPVLPLVDAPLFAVFKPSLETMRWISAGWTVLGLGVAFFLLHGRQRPLAAGLSLLPFAVAPLLLSFLCIGKTYSLAQLFLLLTAAALVLPWGWRSRLCVLSLFGVLAAGTRLTLGPVVGLLWLGFWWQHRREMGWWWATLPVVPTLVILGPFYFADPARFVFWNVQYHLATIVLRHPDGFWMANWSRAPGIWAVTVLALGLVWRVRRADPAGAIMLVAVSGGLVINLIWVGLYAEYVTPFVLLLIVAVARVIVVAGFAQWLQVLILGVATLLNVFFAGIPEPDSAQQRTPILEQAKIAAQFLREHTTAGDLVLACNPEIAIEADRPLFGDLVMGKFAVTNEYGEAEAARLGLLPFRQLNETVASGKLRAIVLTRWANWNFGWTVPSLRTVPEQTNELMSNLKQTYIVGLHGDTYVVLLRRPPIGLPEP